MIVKKLGEFIEEDYQVEESPIQGVVTHTFSPKAREALEKIKSVLEGEKWSQKVKTKWHPPKGLFTKDATTIANTLLKASKDKKQAMSRLNFFINRGGICQVGGEHYDKVWCAELEKAKELIHKAK